ncbi:NFX1-type zinc finger-containing protein 1-like [Physella acuta]|uniref:NFX1-type zinc finger-containing protein 1-like n=1 Tax=Physella acuta TaxID=109671 RepID=UPI0027DC9BE3|nr:NFX1-type zinc finger-containing protein 1-like [Physella acuta]
MKEKGQGECPDQDWPIVQSRGRKTVTLEQQANGLSFFWSADELAGEVHQNGGIPNAQSETPAVKYAEVAKLNGAGAVTVQQNGVVSYQSKTSITESKQDTKQQNKSLNKTQQSASRNDPVHSQPDPTAAHRPRSKGEITDKLLARWLRSGNPAEVLCAMTSMQTALERFLMSDFINNDSFFSFVKAVELATKAAYIRQTLSELLEILCDNKFFSKHAINFFHLTIPKHGCNTRVEAMKSLADILMCTVYVLPAKATTCMTTSVQLQNIRNSSKDLQGMKELKEKFDTLYKTAKEMYTSVNKQTSASEMQISDVDQKSPESFRDLPAYPTLMDVNRTSDTYLQKAVVQGAYIDVEHYLDVQFRLMREDFIIPLRKGIAELKNNPDKIRDKTSDLTLRLYRGARITRVFDKHQLKYSVKFDKMRRVNWKASKRLINGSLVCFSKDNFTTIIFATVCSRDQISGEIEVDIKSGLDDLLSNSPYDIYIMAEATNLFEPYFHVLKGFHEMSQSMPFQQYVIRCETTLKPPRYLLSKTQTVPNYNLSCFMNKDKFWMCPVLTTTKWPPCESMCLNKSQREAAILALTKEMVLIQGPPGTGKTYVGLKVMEAIMKNLDVVFGTGPATPILIVCYTNHALDQFLEGILKFCDDGVVRVGGGSKCEKLQPFLLKEQLNKNRNNSTKNSNRYSIFKAKNECFENMKEIVTEINRLSQQLATIKSGVKSEEELRKYIDDVHYDSLCNDCPESGYNISKMSQWLNSDEEDHQDSLRKRIEDFLYKLVLNWDFRINLDEASKVVSMDITGRASLYYTAVLKLREVLENEMAVLCMQNEPEEVATKIDELKQKIDQTRSRIVPDTEIEQFLPEFETIQRFMKGKKVQEEGMLIKTWIIGPNRGIKDQFDDIETLVKDMGITGVDYFESSDILCSIELTTIDNDDVDDIDEFDDLNDVEYSSLDRDSTDESHELTIKDYMNYNKMSDQVTRLLHLVQNSEESSWTVVDTKKNLQLLPGWMTEDHMAEGQAASITNIWKLNETQKHSLYNLWTQRFRLDILESLQSLLDKHNSEAQKMEEFGKEEKLLTLKSAKIIGMTTTGAAKHRSLLEAVGCKIIVVEEAAEVFESHIITALNAHCNHLILIGDHQQLRPKPNVYELAIEYGLEVSLFERLIKNNVPHVVLKVQHRMRPEISKLMLHIYPELEDDDSVLEYDHIRGVEKDVYFINHTNVESQVDDSLSKENIYEAEYMVALCQYLLDQDYSPQSITILTTYAGQLLALKRLARDESLDPSVRIAVVDDFQGEENDIILLSLVRSNKKKSVGFLKIDNRICVALSRAKKGLYVIGNFSMLSSQSSLWRKIVEETLKCNMIGDGLPICCPSHPENTLVIRSANDFRFRPEGGCGNPCEKRLPCGHVCDRPCHGNDPEHIEHKCKKRCARTCKEGHTCRRLCFKDCGMCEVFVTKTLKCGHEAAMPCGRDPDDHDCEARCPEIFDCSHQCSGKCGRCSRHREHPRCETKVAYQFQPCEDVNDIPCYKTKEDPPCERICNEILDCEHRCKGICSDCSKVGHRACPEICNKILVCGHACKGRCKNCTSNEEHSSCNEKCNAKLECEHQCQGRCGDCAENPHPKCKQTCKGILACSHQCAGICWKCTENTHEQCKKICNALLSCKHKCEGQCGVCSLKGHGTCMRPCKKELACKHTCNGLCGQCSENGHPKCLSTCSATLTCGHKCIGKCGDCSEKGHAKCHDKCKKKLPCTHKCKGDCGECSEKGHSKCPEICNKLLPCRHKCQGICGECAENGLHSKCLKPCSAELPCKHICKGQCGDCSQGTHKQCQDECKALFRCGHHCTAVCGSCKEGGHKQCHADCNKHLPCGHMCPGVCGICQNSGQHNECQEKCTNTLICGHKCAGTCGQPCVPCKEKCPFSCRHGSCCGEVAKHLCGEPCNPCRAIDFFRCDHGGQMIRNCFDKWPKKPCELKCAKRMKVVSFNNGKKTICRHPCAGICGEICVCKVCEQVRPIKKFKVLNISSPQNQKPIKQERLIIKLPSCLHVFYVDELDNYVDNYDPNGTKFLKCPVCQKLITNCPRYENISKERFAKRETLKSQGIVYIPGPVSREPKNKKKREDKNVPTKEDEADIPDYVAAAVAATEQSQKRGAKKNQANDKTNGDSSDDGARGSTAVEIDEKGHNQRGNNTGDGNNGKDGSGGDECGVEESEKKNHSSRKNRKNNKNLKSNQRTSSSSTCSQARSEQDTRDRVANNDGAKGGNTPAVQGKLTKKQKKMNKVLSKVGGHEAAASTSSGTMTTGNGFQNGDIEKKKKEFNYSPFKRRKMINSAMKSAEHSSTTDDATSSATASGGNSYNPSTDSIRKNSESSGGFDHPDKRKNKGKKSFMEDSKAQGDRQQKEKDEDKDSKSKKFSAGKKKHH